MLGSGWGFSRTKREGREDRIQHFPTLFSHLFQHFHTLFSREDRIRVLKFWNRCKEDFEIGGYSWQLHSQIGYLNKIGVSSVRERQTAKKMSDQLSSARFIVQSLDEQVSKKV
jgi:hypothetical protein